MDKYASLIISFLLGFALAGNFHVPAFPHGAAAWIGNGHFFGREGLCCGEEDCGYLSKDAVRATKYGYEVHGFVTVEPENDSPFTYQVDELVPYEDAQPSPDGTYWRCAWGDTAGKTRAERAANSPRKCFFARSMGS